MSMKSPSIPTPTGLRPKAQGCGKAATLGSHPENTPNPERVAPLPPDGTRDILISIDRLVQFTTPMHSPNGYLFRPVDEAKNLGVSKRTVTRYMSYLRTLGYTFEYDEIASVYWSKSTSQRLL